MIIEALAVKIFSMFSLFVSTIYPLRYDASNSVCDPDVILDWWQRGEIFFSLKFYLFIFGFSELRKAYKVVL